MTPSFLLRPNEILDNLAISFSYQNDFTASALLGISVGLKNFPVAFKGYEMTKSSWSVLSLFLGGSLSSVVQAVPVHSHSEDALEACAAMPQSSARLACFDQWAAHKFGPNLPRAAEGDGAGSVASISNWDGSHHALSAVSLSRAEAYTAAEHGHGCENPVFDSLNRLWEMSPSTDCGTLRMRAYAPQIIAVTHGNRVNNNPASPVKRIAPQEVNQKNEVRMQISLRAKLASGIFTSKDSHNIDSIWAAYTQNSYWQLFNREDSSPFRTTDHQPEIFYIYPTTYDLPAGWRLRYTGVGFRHHSNGQRDPWSRSWNTAFIMGGAEYKDRWLMQLKFSERTHFFSGQDENPDIQKYWGNTELRLGWKMDARNSFSLTARGSAFSSGYGSGRLEWFHALGSGWFGQKSNLQLYAQVFHGYGESLIDYNFKRTTFSVGLSLLDF